MKGDGLDFQAKTSEIAAKICQNIMDKPQRLSSGTPWEDKVGYSRAVRIGNTIEISGTTATIEGKVMYPNDAYRQTQFILLRIEQVLKDLGASTKDIVRTRIYTTDIHAYWEKIGRAHLEVFSFNRPASTMIEIYGLIDPALVVEIEATAIMNNSDD